MVDESQSLLVSRVRTRDVIRLPFNQFSFLKSDTV